jgi:hypothetical protein
MSAIAGCGHAPGSPEDRRRLLSALPLRIDHANVYLIEAVRGCAARRAAALVRASGDLFRLEAGNGDLLGLYCLGA